jgi:hypothetical protein
LFVAFWTSTEIDLKNFSMRSSTSSTPLGHLG